MLITKKVFRIAFNLIDVGEIKSSRKNINFLEWGLEKEFGRSVRRNDQYSVLTFQKTQTGNNSLNLRLGK
jgi:hypothetical protein